VEQFCQRQLSFTGITAKVRRVMDAHRAVEHPTLEQILAADRLAREEASR
jgi:1-deoxy-D-xylulose 5-phosphate reductoisomerase